MSVPVVTASEASAIDAVSISSGNPSRALMQRAGAAAATEVTRRYGALLSQGVAVFAGPGNNGGDAWVLAAALATLGVPVSLLDSGSNTPDAAAERARAMSAHTFQAPTGREAIVVDGLLGTGVTGAVRSPVAEHVARIDVLRRGGATVIALDLPTGLDATTGFSDGGVKADLTLSFGSIKRGQLLNREQCGQIAVLDIGLGDALAAVRAASLIDRHSALSPVPHIPADAHKGSRKRLGIVGGAAGMFGAAGLAAEGALRSGIGLVRLIVDEQSLAIAQSTMYHALAAKWPTEKVEASALTGDWAHALVVGPGLGTSDSALALLHVIADVYSGPLVLDADALNIASSNRDLLRRLVASRAAVLTPHVNEMARLVGVPADIILESRFDIASTVAKEYGAVVLLKGVPTLIAAPDGRVNVSAAGSPVLATGGSGDILSGMVGTLLAQTGDPFVAASSAAWVHGRAGEIAAANGHHHARGHTLADVLNALPLAWSEPELAPLYPVLAELPDLSE